MAALRLADARGRSGSRRCERGQPRDRGHGHAARRQCDCPCSQVDSIATVWQGRRNKKAGCWQAASMSAALFAFFVNTLSCSTTTICSSAECWSCCFCTSTCFSAARGCAAAACWCTACFASCATPCAASGPAAGASMACKEACGSCTHPLWPGVASLATPCASHGSTLACCSGASCSSGGCYCRELIGSGGFFDRFGGAARRISTFRAWPSRRVAGRDAHLGGQAARSSSIALAGIPSAGVGDRGGGPDVQCSCGVRMGAGRGASRYQPRLACLELSAHGDARHRPQAGSVGPTRAPWSRAPSNAAMPCEPIAGGVAGVGASDYGGRLGRPEGAGGRGLWLLTLEVRVRGRLSRRRWGRGAPWVIMT